MSKQRVSVVVTTHFRDDMLAECLASLAAQTIPLYEVVVVDDGGGGSARKLVEQYGTRFRYLWQSNGGMQNARNQGAQASIGEWIAFLDDDDLWLPERHALVAELIATGRVDLISGDFIKFGDGWVAPTGVFKEIEQQSPKFWDEIPRAPGIAVSIVDSFPTTRLFPVHAFWPSTLVIQRDVFNRLNGWNESLNGIKAEDFEFVFRALKISRLGIIWHPTIHYRCHLGNDSNSDLSVALGRKHVWKILLTNPSSTNDDKVALINAINNISKKIIWSAFLCKNYSVVLKTAKEVGFFKLSTAGKIKTLYSAIAIKILKTEA